MVDAARAEPLLGEPEPVAGVADEVRRRHPDVAVEDLGVAAVDLAADLWVVHHRDVAGHVEPGVSVGTMIIEARWYGGASGSVTTIAIRKSAPVAFEENHLWPLMT